MKWLSFLAMALVAVSCVMYSDKDDVVDPASKIATDVYNIYMSDVFRSVELCRFFDEYQTVREDRDASEELWKAYFGDSPVSLYYERAEVYPWGTVRLTETAGEYRVEHYHNGCESVVSVAEGKTAVSMSAPNGKTVLEAETGISGSLMEMSSLKMSVSDYNGSEISVSVVKPLQMNVCSEGDYSYIPDSGTLKYIISGEVSDEFTVSYDGTGFVVNNDGVENKFTVEEE